MPRYSILLANSTASGGQRTAENTFLIEQFSGAGTFSVRLPNPIRREVEGVECIWPSLLKQFLRDVVTVWDIN